MSGTEQQDRLRAAWREGFDAAERMVAVAADLAGGAKTIGGGAIRGTARSMRRTRDDAEQQAEARGVFAELPDRPNTEGAKR